ncbi:hypothetical protein BLNAU_12132 [Blattamonas nauphoetae]|uniref:Secreted protein n=1 Tax=Blattamonas nauphoetae TaxID=2049346 RepID=A0ABQ9XQZ0_9EUKA|nr:hypothetical protein BLNAU_12413 [Blattamonas nauphoetae]KAK2952956.1 hypothetical protein BLNAU_12132 [Blattamonas nauphoetae]
MMISRRSLALLSLIPSTFAEIVYSQTKIKMYSVECRNSVGYENLEDHRLRNGSDFCESLKAMNVSFLSSIILPTLISDPTRPFLRCLSRKMLKLHCSSKMCNSSKNATISHS